MSSYRHGYLITSVTDRNQTQLRSERIDGAKQEGQQPLKREQEEARTIVYRKEERELLKQQKTGNLNKTAVMQLKSFADASECVT